MSKIREFFANLKKSTKITLISCVSFVLMTFLILCFFIMSPITPSDKAGKTFGRESISDDGSTVSTVITTIDENGNIVEVSKGTTNVASTASTVTTTHKEYVRTITTGTYFVDGKIVIGDYDNGYTYSTTTTAYSGYSGGEYTTTTAGDGGDEPDTTQDSGSDEPTTTTTNEGGETPTEQTTVAEPIQTTTTEMQQVTEPVKPTEPPVDTGSDTPPEGGGGESAQTW